MLVASSMGNVMRVDSYDEAKEIIVGSEVEQLREVMRSSRRFMWLPILLGMLLGIGGYSATRGAVSFGDSALYVQCLAYAAAMCALFPLLYALQEWIVVHGGAQSTQPAIAEEAKDFSSSRMTGLRAIARFEHDFRVSSLLRDALRMFVCWSPYIILMYPGILYWDTGDQLAQFFGMPVFGQESGQIWDHHPFLDTYFYGSVIWLGHAISGRYEVGLFMLSMLHAFLACLAVSSMLTYFRKRQLARKPLAVVTAVFCFFPVFPIMFSSIVKDTTNVIVFLIWLTMYLCLIDSRLARIAKPGFLMGFMMMTVLLALTKKVGLYVAVAAILLLVVGTYRKRFKAVCVIVAIGCFAFVSVFLPKVVFPRLNIIPGERQAAIVVPIQMVARVAHINPSDVTEKEKQTLNEYLPMSWDEMGRNYVPFTADPVTGYAMKTGGSATDFAKTWLSVGLKHPRAYVQAFISVESGWFAFNGAPANNVGPQSPYPEIALQYQPLTSNALNDGTFGQFMPNGEPSKGQAAVKSLIRALQDIPVVNVFMYIAVWTSIVPVYMVYALIRRHASRDDVLRFVPYWVSTAFLFLCAVTIQLQNDHSSPTRYAFQALVLGVLSLAMLSETSSGKQRID